MVTKIPTMEHPENREDEDGVHREGGSGKVQTMPDHLRHGYPIGIYRQ